MLPSHIFTYFAINFHETSISILFFLIYLRVLIHTYLAASSFDTLHLKTIPKRTCTGCVLFPKSDSLSDKFLINFNSPFIQRNADIGILHTNGGNTRRLLRNSTCPKTQQEMVKDGRLRTRRLSLRLHDQHRVGPRLRPGPRKA